MYYCIWWSFGTSVFKRMHSRPSHKMAQRGPPLSQGKNILSRAVQDLCSPQAESLVFAGQRRGSSFVGPTTCECLGGRTLRSPAGSRCPCSTAWVIVKQIPGILRSHQLGKTLCRKSCVLLHRPQGVLRGLETDGASVSTPPAAADTGASSPVSRTEPGGRV